MFEGILNFFRGLKKTENKGSNSGGTAKERLHLVLMQDRANVSADFLELMKQEIIDVIKKYIEVDESAIDVRLTNKNGEDGENGAPALYANIPILNIRNDMKKIDPATGKANPEDKPVKDDNKKENKEENKEDNKEESKEENKVDEKQEMTEEAEKNEASEEQEEIDTIENTKEHIKNEFSEDKNEESKEENEVKENSENNENNEEENK